jgi:glycosyltransferase involved in cell wall biosynthesis
MILALVTPFYFPSVRGNSITVQRIASGLRDQGLGVEVYSLDRQDPETIRRDLARLRPDVVHGFHATATGSLTVEVAARLGVPAVISLTGTDVNQDLFDPRHRSAVLEALRAARATVTFHQVIRDKLCREAPALAGRVHIIGQAVRCDGESFDLRAALGLHPGDFIFFQPAGIRRVKNIPAVIPPLAALQRRYPHLRYVLAGPVIEPDEAERITALLTGFPWARSLGAVGHERVCAALNAVESVINSSLSEGGMSNAVLEAMSKGVAVLASDIEGNRSVIRDGEDGLLFGSEAEFLVKAERLLTDPAFRLRLGRRARQKVVAEFPLAGEIGKYLALYRALAAGSGAEAAWT